MKNTTLFKYIGASASLSLIFASNAAWAHHPMGGETPATFINGFLSGIGHPIIGIDHLAFIIAVGLASLFTPQRFLSPLAFIAATLAGCLIAYAGATLPFAEFIIASSVLLLGAIVLTNTQLPVAGYLAIFAIAGLFHGYAYGEAIIGAEATPLFAYLLGFGATQYAIAVGAGFLGQALNTSEETLLKVRLAGAVIAGIGATFVIEYVEGMIFAADTLS